MSEQNFSIAEAARILADQGLLAGIHLPGGAGTWNGEDALPRLDSLAGGFLGAGLDNRTLQPEELFVALQGERADGRRFAPAALASGHWVLTRPVAGEDDLAGGAAGSGVLLSQDPERALTALAAAWRQRFSPRVVGITGSNGKTTTKDFTGALLAAAGPTWVTRGNLNSKLGLPQTLLGLRAEHRYAVIEMGASAVGHIAHLAALARPTVAVITNAGQAHLAEFGSLDAVIQGKGEILDTLPPDGRAVLNTDSPGYRRWVERAPCPVISFGRREGDYLWSWRADGPAGPQVEVAGEIWPVPLPGEHNGANLVAAMVAAMALGLDADAIRRGLGAFRGSDHRSQVLRVGGRTILDDAYNANPVSMVAAAQALVEMKTAGQPVAVLGHMAELGPESEGLHHSTGRILADCGIRRLLTVGPLAEALAHGFMQNGGEASSCADLDAAAAWLLASTSVGDRILVKGSRSAGMEELVPKFEALIAAREAGP
jgi:UDP-N-acetylmuramoyl-tripeptide--D-alanyl-D-alanine ligase